MQTTHLDTVFTNPDTIRALQSLLKMVNIVKKHKLDELYPTEMRIADEQLQRLPNNEDAGIAAALASIKANVKTFDHYNSHQRGEYGSFRYPSNPWEMKFKKYIDGIIPAIKAYREITGASLMDAKLSVEKIRDRIYSEMKEI